MRWMLVLLFVLAAGASHAGPSLPVYSDPHAGFQIGKPGGWKIDYYDGSIVVTKDAAGLIGVLVLPARVQTDLSAAQFLDEFASAIAGAIEDAGGTFQLTARKGASAVAMASVDGVTLKAPMVVSREPGFVTLKLYFAPVSSFAREEPMLKQVLASFKRATAVGGAGVMRRWHGQYYSALVPAGWKLMGETDRGVDLVAPDGSAMVSSGFVAGGLAGGTPGTIVQQTLPMVVPDARVLKAVELGAPVPGWESLAAEFEGTWRGRRVHGVYTVTSGAAGFYSGLRVADAGRWEADKLLLGRVMESIQLVRAVSSDVMLPRNNPLDDSSIMSSWASRNASQDRGAQQWSNATLGVEQVRSGSTGESWTVSQNAWWGNGPQGPGYYRPLPGGSYEQLEIVR